MVVASNGDPCVYCANVDEADIAHVGVEATILAELRELRPHFELPAQISVHPAYFSAERKHERIVGTPCENLPCDFSRALFDQELTALCLSGGGIRSASFCLGILQELARKQMLARFDYISTVSGGGYIGSWLSAWRKHCTDKDRERDSLLHETREAVKVAKTKSDVLKCLENAERAAATRDQFDMRRLLESAHDHVKSSENTEYARKEALSKLERGAIAAPNDLRSRGREGRDSAASGRPATAMEKIERELGGNADEGRHPKKEAPESAICGAIPII